MGLRLSQLPKSVATTLRAAVPKVDRVTVPAPPSTNNLYLNAKGKGRVKSPEYRAWIDATAGLWAELASPESYPCEFYVIFQGKWDRHRDGDNAFKPLLDACVAAGVIAGDSLARVWGWHGVYAPHLGGDVPECVVWFEACGGAA